MGKFYSFIRYEELVRRKEVRLRKGHREVKDEQRREEGAREWREEAYALIALMVTAVRFIYF